MLDSIWLFIERNTWLILRQAPGQRCAQEATALSYSIAGIIGTSGQPTRIRLPPACAIERTPFIFFGGGLRDDGRPVNSRSGWARILAKIAIDKRDPVVYFQKSTTDRRWACRP